MADKYNTAAMKKLVNGLESSRAGIATKKNISANMESLRATFNELEPAMKGQLAYIKSLSTTEKENKSESEKASESKRYMLKIVELVRGDMTEMVSNAKKFFQLNKREKKVEQGWERIQSELEKKLNSLKDSLTSNNHFEMLFRLLNARDSFHRQFLKCMLYRKNNLWLDLNVPFESYVHSEIKSVLNLIRDHKEKQGYVPTTLEFQVPTFEEEGRWRLNQPEKEEESSLPTMVRLVVSDFNELIDTVRNYSKLNDTPEMFEDINKNQQVVKGLREKVELLTNNYNTLLEKYREVQANHARSDDKGSLKELKDKVDELELALSKKDNEINSLRSSTQGTESQIIALKEKLKESEEEVVKFQTYQAPKLKELEMIQHNLTDEFGKLRKEVDTYSSLFQM